MREGEHCIRPHLQWQSEGWVCGKIWADNLSGGCLFAFVSSRNRMTLEGVPREWVWASKDFYTFFHSSTEGSGFAGEPWHCDKDHLYTQCACHAGGGLALVALMSLPIPNF